MFMIRKLCLGTFQDLRGPVMGTVNVQSILIMSKHIDQKFFFKILVFFLVYTSTCNYFM